MYLSLSLRLYLLASLSFLALSRLSCRISSYLSCRILSLSCFVFVLPCLAVSCSSPVLSCFVWSLSCLVTVNCFLLSYPASHDASPILSCLSLSCVRLNGPKKIASVYRVGLKEEANRSLDSNQKIILYECTLQKRTDDHSVQKEYIAEKRRVSRQDKTRQGKT